MKQVDEISAKLTEPSVLPFTVAGGAVVAAIVGYSGWRFATGAREGELSAAQKAVAKKITSAMASGKRIHVRRVRQAEAGACAATVAKALVGDDSALPAMCPKVRGWLRTRRAVAPACGCARARVGWGAAQRL